MKPPVSEPAEIEHADEAKSPEGAAVMTHVVPAKSEPDAETTVPMGPEVSDKVKLGPVGTVKDSLPVSPVVPVTLTVYAPSASEATTKDPVMLPAATMQTWFEIRPPGVDEIEQPESLESKPDPVTRTFVPGRPELGNRLIPGITKNWSVAASRTGTPVTVIV